MVLCLHRLEASPAARSGRPLVSFSGQAPLKRNKAEVGAPSGAVCHGEGAPAAMLKAFLPHSRRGDGVPHPTV